MASHLVGSFVQQLVALQHRISRIQTLDCLDNRFLLGAWNRSRLRIDHRWLVCLILTRQKLGKRQQRLLLRVGQWAEKTQQFTFSGRHRQFSPRSD